ncbi:MAG TPA: N-formylglutamate amidohydrolase [Polyangiaceae bacterium]|nr:N-formylglutamate amidohydrolase [Polyangiaceae bacterium]
MVGAGEVYFSVENARSVETPVIVEVPHAGISLDPESMALCAAPVRSLGRDADLFVDRLFADAPDEGASLLVGKASRYLVDLNRAPDDLDSHTTPGGKSTGSPHGVVWRRTTEGRPALAGPLPQSEVQRRLDLVYWPYHRALERLVAEKIQRFGFALLLCGHSMPSFGRLGERRADVVPGTRGRTTAAATAIDALDQLARQHGFDVAHDTPYRGGYTTERYGRPEERLHAIQIELARRLYMDETALRPGAGFETARRFCRELVRHLGTLRLA